MSRENDQKENSVTGIKWVEMVGKFSLLSVGLNDQVRATFNFTILVQLAFLVYYARLFFLQASYSFKQ